MEKAAEYEAKEDELSELRTKGDKAQQQILVLKEDFCKKDAELRTTQSALNEEKKKNGNILVNAKRKIQKLNQDLTAARRW